MHQGSAVRYPQEMLGCLHPLHATMESGHIQDTVLVSCVLIGKEFLLLCGLSDGKYKGFSVVRWLFGSGSAWLLCLCFCGCCGSCLQAMPGLCCFLCVNTRRVQQRLGIAEEGTKHDTLKNNIRS